MASVVHGYWVHPGFLLFTAFVGVMAGQAFVKADWKIDEVG